MASSKLNLAKEYESRMTALRDAAKEAKENEKHELRLYGDHVKKVAANAALAASYRNQARAEHLAETNARNVSRGFVPRNRTVHRRESEGAGGLDCCVLMMVVLVLTVSVVGSVGRVLSGGGYITNDLKVLLNAVNINYPKNKSDTDILNDLTLRIVNICKNPATFTDSPELTNSIENILNTYENNVIYPQLLTLSNVIKSKNKKSKSKPKSKK